MDRNRLKRITWDEETTPEAMTLEEAKEAHKAAKKRVKEIAEEVQQAQETPEKTDTDR